MFDPPGWTELPLIGWEREMSQLRSWYGQALRGSAPLVLLEGEAGIGKSHLLRAFARWCGEQGARVILATCREADVGLPYGVFIRTVRHLMRSVSAAALSAALSSPQFGPHLKVLSHLIPGLTDIVAVSLRGASSSDLAGSDHFSTAQVHAALVDLLRIAVRGQPLVIILDDMQWIDSATLTLGQVLYRQVVPLPVLMVGSYCPDEAPPKHPLHDFRVRLLRMGLLARMRLRPLDAESMRRLARALLPDLPDPELENWQQEGEDSPALWAARARAFLVSQRIGPLLNGLREINEWVVTRLEADARHLLEAAAILGIETDGETLSAIADVPAGRAPALLKGLMRARFLIGDGELYAIADTQLARTLYEMLGSEQRRQLHLRAGQRLESLHRALPHVAAAMLARHYREARVPNLALHYLAMAADWARRCRALREAEDLYWEALGQAAALDDASAQTQIYAGLGDVYLQGGDQIAARGNLHAALASAASRVQQAMIRVYLARSLGASGEYDAARATLLSAQETLEGEPDARARGVIELHLAWVEGLLDNGQAALEYAQSALADAEQARDDLLQADAALQLALLYHRQQMLDQARQACLSSAQIRERFGDWEGCARVWARLGLIECDRQRPQEAIAWLARSADLYRQTGDSNAEAQARIHLAELYEAAGDLAKAVHEFRQVLTLLAEGYRADQALELPLWTHPFLG